MYEDEPVLVNSSWTFVKVETGYTHSCALLTNGSVACWGWNNQRQLGDGTTSTRYSPVLVKTNGIFKDISFKIAPVNKSDALAMINETKASAILSGARGRAVRDIGSLQTCIQRLSQLALDCPQIKELDINPLIVLEEGKGSFVADAKIML